MTTVDLVVTDLDGTFWSGHEETHPATIAAWRELERRGMPILVATGRRVASTRVPLAHLGFAPPAVMMNGALAIDLRTEERFHSHRYTTGDAVKILAVFRDVGLEPCVYVDHPKFDVFVGERPSTHPQHLAGLGSSAERADLETIVSTVPVLMFGIMGHDAAPLNAFVAALGGIAESHVAGSDMYGAHSFTATPIGLSKWTGVEAYCAHAGLDPARVLAIGDGPNDTELLDAAAISVVPADGHDVALRVADHVVASPRDGGWAEILDLV